MLLLIGKDVFELPNRLIVPIVFARVEFILIFKFFVVPMRVRFFPEITTPNSSKQMKVIIKIAQAVDRKGKRRFSNLCWIAGIYNGRRWLGILLYVVIDDQ